MATHPVTIDISNNPDLVRLVEEMKHAKQPRILEENNTPVAMLMPMGHSALEVFDFQPLGVVKQGFLDAGYPEAEVNDMLQALSELPQYAGKDIRKST